MSRNYLFRNVIACTDNGTIMRKMDERRIFESDVIQTLGELKISLMILIRFLFINKSTFGFPSNR